MKKPYEAHETAYRKMGKDRIASWDQFLGRRTQIDPKVKPFLSDVLAQPWAPKKGKAIELGCGTAPILRWICDKGFTGIGIDISKTAITIAKRQAKSTNLRFRRADLCDLNTAGLGKFDLVIDGHCLHCITDPDDRQTFLQNASSLMNKSAAFIIMTMCSPINRKLFASLCKGQKIINHTIYTPSAQARKYHGAITA